MDSVWPKSVASRRSVHGNGEALHTVARPWTEDGFCDTMMNTPLVGRQPNGYPPSPGGPMGPGRHPRHNLSRRVKLSKKIVAFLSIGLLVVTTLFIPSTSTAQWEDYVIVQPPQPTEADEISIIVGGMWANSCIPQYYYHSIHGNTIVIYAVADAPPGVFCAMVITSWEFTTHIGHLPAGSYTVELRIFSLWGWECPPCFGYFHVRAEATIIRLYLPLVATSG